MLPVYLDFPFLFAPLVFSNIYFLKKCHPIKNLSYAFLFLKQMAKCTTVTDIDIVKDDYCTTMTDIDIVMDD